jgi:hypothetical protein
MGGMVIGWLLGIVVLILVVFALIKYLRSKWWTQSEPKAADVGSLLVTKGCWRRSSKRRFRNELDLLILPSVACLQSSVEPACGKQSKADGGLRWFEPPE